MTPQTLPQRLLAAFDSGLPWAGGLGQTTAEAYATALALRALREARGERPCGFKIGFTNASIWPRYNVAGPLWGTVWDTSVAFCDGSATVSLGNSCQPRIEPEAVFGFKATPPPSATVAELFACLDWVAPGFEVVQCHMPNWKFAAPDAIADGGLHARLLVGPRTPVHELAGSAAQLQTLLAQAQVVLSCNGQERETGQGAKVLGDPLLALNHFLAELRACPNAPDIQRGDVVTTGTWTDAWPVKPGETWLGAFQSPLVPLEVTFGV